MDLDAPFYIIINVQTNTSVGLVNTKDYPRRVVTKPANETESLWSLKKRPNGTHLIQTAEDTTFTENSLVYAAKGRDEPEKLEEWKIVRRENHGPNVFTIEEVGTESSRGWVLGREQIQPGAQVAYKSLIMTESLPPQFLPGELWIFKPIL
ncbi:hypothetical protein BD779DRAFT_1677936 [Infundibulicybe gibba]|nr:hypothetical protein BD779DRAFT_1677936 [Infundibulicybe gibba]